MRLERDALLPCKFKCFEQIGYAAHLGGIRLNEIDRLRCKYLSNIVEVAQIFTGGDRNTSMATHFGQRPIVVRRKYWFFQPGKIELFSSFAISIECCKSQAQFVSSIRG